MINIQFKLSEKQAKIYDAIMGDDRFIAKRIAELKGFDESEVGSLMEYLQLCYVGEKKYALNRRIWGSE